MTSVVIRDVQRHDRCWPKRGAAARIAQDDKRLFGQFEIRIVDERDGPGELGGARLKDQRGACGRKIGIGESIAAAGADVDRGFCQRIAPPDHADSGRPVGLVHVELGVGEFDHATGRRGA
jgi:hypothetical protein